MPQTRGLTVNKAVLTILFLAGCYVCLSAQTVQPNPTNAPGSKPGSGSEDATQQAVRAALDRMYAQRAKTNESSIATATNQIPVEKAADVGLVPPTVPPTNNPQLAQPPANLPAPAAPAAVSSTNRPSTLTRPAAPPVVAGQSTNLPRAVTGPPAPVPLPGRTNLQPAAIVGPPSPAQPGNLPPGASPPSPGLVPPPAGPTSVPDTNAVAAGTNAAPLKADEVFPPGLIKFQEADLVQVLDIYQELTGRTVLRPANLPQAKITVRTQTELTRKEAISALDSILSLNSVSMVPQGEKFVKAVATQEATQQGREFNSEKYQELPESGSFVVQIVKLKNTVPRDVAQALQPFAKNPQAILGIDASGIVILRDNAENVKRMMEVLEKIDVVPVQEFESIVIPIKYALAADIAQVLSSLTEGGSATTVGSSTAQTGLSMGAGLGSRGTGSLQGYNANTPYNQQMRGMTAGPTGPQSSFQDRLRGIVNKAVQAGGGDITVLGQTKIIADERTNSLLIFASKNDIPTIKDIVEKLDVVLPQVLIEAIIVEVALDDSWEYGVSMARSGSIGNTTARISSIGRINPASEDPASLTNVLEQIPGFRYFGKFNDDFDIAVKAFSSDSRVNVLSRPRIQTSHAVEANLFVGETRPYITGTYYGGIGGYGGTSQYQQLQIGITLSVLPLINADGLVVMDIRQRIQSVGGKVIIDNNEVPITNDREANAKVAVRDRETIMLGGFISSDRRKDKSGIPFLKDLPLLGFLFRGSSSSDNRRELIVLIRPTVLPTPGEAAQIAKEMKQGLPGVVAAEADYNEAERKQLNQSQRQLLKREGFRY
jgi:general secretion pathway protein D